MEINIKDYELGKKTISFTIKEERITGITGNSKEDLENIIYLKNKYNGKITINKKSNININEYKEKIVLIKKNMLNKYFQGKVYELMYYEIKRKALILKNPRKKILDSLKIVGLDYTYLNRDLITLSNSEKRLLELSISLLSNPELIIVEEPFIGLDMKKEKEIYSLYKMMIEKYHKTIVFISDDTTMLYKYTDNIIITKNDKVILEDETINAFQKVSILEENNIEVPEIVLITYLAKKKDIKIDYHKDIRDIIKDIYKHIKRR